MESLGRTMDKFGAKTERDMGAAENGMDRFGRATENSAGKVTASMEAMERSVSQATSSAQRDLGEMSATMAAVDAQNVNPDIDVDVAPAIAQLELLQAKLRETNAMSVNIGGGMGSVGGAGLRGGMQSRGGMFARARAAAWAGAKQWAMNRAKRYARDKATSAWETMKSAFRGATYDGEDALENTAKGAEKASQKMSLFNRVARTMAYRVLTLTGVVLALGPALNATAGALSAFIGTAGAATAGGLIGAGAVLGTATVGVAGFAGALLPLMGRLSSAKKYMDAYTRAVVTYGKNSKEAAEKHDIFVRATTPQTRRIFQEKKAFGQFWNRATKPGQNAIAGFMGRSLRRLRTGGLGDLGADLSNMGAAGVTASGDNFLGTLDSPMFQKSMRIIGNTFQDVSPAFGDAMGNFIRMLANVTAASRPEVIEFFKWLDKFMSGAATKTGNLKKTGDTIKDWTKDFKLWVSFFKQLTLLAVTFFGAGKGNGRNMLKDLTQSMREQREEWQKNPRGLKSWFDEQENNFRVLAKEIGRAATGIGNLIGLLSKLVGPLSDVSDAMHGISNATLGKLPGNWGQAAGPLGGMALTAGGIYAATRGGRWAARNTLGRIPGLGKIFGGIGGSPTGSATDPLWVRMWNGIRGPGGAPTPVGGAPGEAGGVAETGERLGKKIIPGWKTTAGATAVLAGFMNAGKPGVGNTPGNKLKAFVQGADPTQIVGAASDLVGGPHIPKVTDLLGGVTTHRQTLQNLDYYIRTGKDLPTRPTAEAERRARDAIRSGRRAGTIPTTPTLMAQGQTYNAHSRDFGRGASIPGVAISQTDMNVAEAQATKLAALWKKSRQDPKDWADNYKKYSKQVVNSWKGLDDTITVKNGHIYSNSMKQWGNTQDAIVSAAQGAEQDAGLAFQNLTQQAIGQMVSFGYSRQDAMNILKGGSVGTGIAVAGGIIGGGPGGGKKGHKGKNAASGGYFSGRGMQDTVPVPGGMAAPGEFWIGNQHTERRINSMLAPYGTSVGREIGAETRSHSSPLAMVTHSGYGYGPKHFAHGGRGGRGYSRRVSSLGGGLLPGHPELQQGISKVTEAVLSKFPGLQVTSTTGGGHVSGSYHYSGQATDIAGDVNTMHQAAAWIKQSGLYHKLAEGIHNPNLSVSDGNMVDPSFYAAVWANHADHIHLAVTEQIGKLITGAGAAAGMITGAGGPSVNLKAPKSKHKGIPGALANMAIGAVGKGMQDKINKKLGGGAAGMVAPKGGGVMGQIASVLMAAGFNKIATAGIIGNAYGESNLVPTADDGAGNGGLWGFTAHPYSKSDMISWITKRGMNWQDASAQTKFLLQFIGGMRGQLNAAGSPEAAAELFMNLFEKPGIPRLDVRQKGARDAFAKGYRKGFSGMVNEPTLFVAGEGNTREHVEIAPDVKSGGRKKGGRGDAPLIHIEKLVANHEGDIEKELMKVAAKIRDYIDGEDEAGS